MNRDVFALEMRAAPSLQLIDDGEQSSTRVGKLVPHVARGIDCDVAHDKPRAFQGAQLLNQYLMRYPRYLVIQIREPLGIAREKRENLRSPFLLQDSNREIARRRRWSASTRFHSPLFTLPLAC